MNRYYIRRIVVSILVFALITLCITALADKDNVYVLTSNMARVKMQHDKGFNYKENINKNDPHYGWGLGEFRIKGFTSVEYDENGFPIFYKNENDKLTLEFSLKQNINKLDGKKDIVISEDTNGFDAYFEVEETNFGKGCLIIQKTDSENHTGKPQVYKDYLANIQSKKSYPDLNALDVGTYECALDYELQSPGFLGNPIYNDYTIRFVFKIVNNSLIPSRMPLELSGSLKEISSGVIIGSIAGFILSSSVVTIVGRRRVRKIAAEHIAKLEKRQIEPILIEAPDEARQKKLNSGDG